MTDRELLELLLKNQDDMKSDMASIKSDISELKENQAAMQADITGMKSDISALKSDVAEIKLDIENRIDPTLNLLLEHQLSNSDRFVSLEKDVQEIKDNTVINEVIRDIKI